MFSISIVDPLKTSTGKKNISTAHLKRAVVRRICKATLIQ